MAITHSTSKTSGERGYAEDWNADHVIADDTILGSKIADDQITKNHLQDGAATGKAVTDTGVGIWNLTTSLDYDPELSITINPTRAANVLVIFNGQFFLTASRSHPSVELYINLNGFDYAITKRMILVKDTDATEQRIIMSTSSLFSISAGANTFRIRARGLADSGVAPHAYGFVRELTVVF